MNNFDFDTLRLFQKVAELGSFTQAADALDMGQPTLSRKIAQLEKHIGIKLFYRGGKAIHLTSSGMQFLETVSRMLEEFNTSVTLIKDDPDDIRGEVSLTMLAPMMRWLSTDFISGFVEKYPHISLNLITLSSTSLDEFDGDLLLCPRLPNNPNYVALKLFVSTCYFYASPEYIEKNGKPVSLRSLAKYNFIANPIIHEDTTEFSFFNNNRGTQTTTQLNTIVKTDSIDAATILTKQGLGLTLLPFTQAKTSVESGELVEVFDRKYYHQFTYYLVYKSRDYVPMRMKVLGEELKHFYLNSVSRIEGEL